MRTVHREIYIQYNKRFNGSVDIKAKAAKQSIYQSSKTKSVGSLYINNYRSNQQRDASRWSNPNFIARTVLNYMLNHKNVAYYQN